MSLPHPFYHPLSYPPIPAVPGSSLASPGDVVTLTLIPVQPPSPSHPLASPGGQGRCPEDEMVEEEVVVSPHHYSVPFDGGDDAGNVGGEEAPPLPEGPRDEFLRRLERLEALGMPPHAHDSKVLEAMQAQVAAQGQMHTELMGIGREMAAFHQSVQTEMGSLRNRLVCMETAMTVAEKARQRDDSSQRALLRSLTSAVNAQTRLHRTSFELMIAAMNGITAAIQQRAISAIPSPVPPAPSSSSTSASGASAQPTPASTPPSRVRRGPRVRGGPRRCARGRAEDSGKGDEGSKGDEGGNGDGSSKGQ